MSQSGNTVVEEPILDLADLKNLVIKAKWVLLAWWAGFALVFLGAVIIAKPIWKCTSEIVMPLQEGGTLSSQVAAATGASKTDPLLILEGIANSREMMEYLGKKYKMDPDDVDDMLDISSQAKTNQLEVTIMDENKKKALSMANDAMEYLFTITERVAMDMAKRQNRFVEKALAEQKALQLESEQKLLAYEKTMKTFPVPSPVVPDTFTAADYRKRLVEVNIEISRLEQQISVLKSKATDALKSDNYLNAGGTQLSVLKANLSTTEYQFRVAEAAFGPKSPTYVRAKQAYDAAKEQLRADVARLMKGIQSGLDPDVIALESQRQVLLWERGYVEDLVRAAPIEAAEITRLSREVSALYKTAEGTRQQRDQAILDAQIYKARFSVLVQPYIDRKPPNKRKAKPLIIATVLSLCFSIPHAYRKFGKKATAATAA